LFNRCRQRQQAVFINVGGGDNVGDLRLALAGSGIEAEVNGSRILICAASKAAPAEHEAQIQQLESAGLVQPLPPAPAGRFHQRRRW
jgi:NAD(P)H-hydrate repair Nnr-like enzyme with NAD(P)H-hydrate epimerase domain